MLLVLRQRTLSLPSTSTAIPLAQRAVARVVLVGRRCQCHGHGLRSTTGAASSSTSVHESHLRQQHHRALPLPRAPTTEEKNITNNNNSSSSPTTHGNRLRITRSCQPRLPTRCLSSRASKNSGGKTRGGGGRRSAAPSTSKSTSTETAEPVITFNGVGKILPGGRQLFKDASLSFVRGAKVGVLGVNGSGKSTVLKILAGEGQYLLHYYHTMLVDVIVVRASYVAMTYSLTLATLSRNWGVGTTRAYKPSPSR